MARAIRPALLLVLAAAIAATLLLTGTVGGAKPTLAGAAQAQQTHGQAGDREAPDTESGQGETAGENENGNEGASEPAGETQPGHEDADGKQVDHQCPPDCAPGELP